MKMVIKSQYALFLNARAVYISSHVIQKIPKLLDMLRDRREKARQR